MIWDNGMEEKEKNNPFSFEFFKLSDKIYVT